LTALWGRMERPSGARLKAGQVYRITLEKPERHSLPPIFAARFLENRPRYDFHNGHFTGWQAIFEVTEGDGSNKRTFGLPYESFSVESLADLASAQIWY